MRCPVAVFFGLLLCQVWLPTPQPLKLCFKPKLGWAGSQHSFPVGRPVGCHTFSTGLFSQQLPYCCAHFPPGVNATFWVLPRSGFLRAREWKGCFRAASPPGSYRCAPRQTACFPVCFCTPSTLGHCHGESAGWEGFIIPPGWHWCAKVSPSYEHSFSFLSRFAFSVDFPSSCMLKRTSTSSKA